MGRCVDEVDVVDVEVAEDDGVEVEVDDDDDDDDDDDGNDDAGRSGLRTCFTITGHDCSKT